MIAKLMTGFGNWLVRITTNLPEGDTVNWIRWVISFIHYAAPDGFHRIAPFPMWVIGWWESRPGSEG